MNIVEKMDIFATAAHAAVGQVRKYTGEPYIVHPRHVREILLKFCTSEVTPEMEAIALGHDVCEDTDVTIELIDEIFGKEIAEGIGWLTDVSKPSDGNRKVRKEIDRQHTVQAPVRFKNIKISDLISNTYSIREHDPNFAEVYLKEKAALLASCDDADPGLLAEAHRILTESISILENERLQASLKK
jgi:(p)ppGpp synthase/HD superfamily hydrolase